MNADTAEREIDSTGKARQSRNPLPELLPFLDALAELLAKQVICELQNPDDQTDATGAALTSCDITKLQVQEFTYHCDRKSEQ